MFWNKKRKIDQLLEYINILEKKLDEKEVNNTHLQTEQDNKTSAIVELTQELEIKDKKITAISNELDILQEKIKTLGNNKNENNVNELTAYIQTIEKELKDAETNFDEIRIENRKLIKTNKELLSKNKEIEDNDVTEKYNLLLKNNHETLLLLSARDAELLEFQNNKESEISFLQSKIKENLTTIKSLENELLVMKKTKSNQNESATIQELREENDFYYNTLNKTKAELRQAKNKITQLENQIKDLTN